MPLPALEEPGAVAEEFSPGWKRQDLRVHRRVVEHRVEFEIVQPAPVISALVAVLSDCGFELDDAGDLVQRTMLAGFVLDG